MDVAVDRIPTLVAGAGTLLFGLVVLGMSPRSPLHRAFALFCGLRGGMLSLQAFSSPFDDMAGRLSVYLLLAIPFAAVWLGLVFMRQHRRRRRQDVASAAVLVALAAVTEALYLADHGLFFDPGPLYLFFPLQFLAYACVGLLIAYKHRTCPPGPGRRALYPLALAFVAEPAYWATTVVYDRLRMADGGLSVMVLALVAATIAVVAATGTLVALHRKDDELAHDRWRFLLVQGLAIGTGLTTFALSRWAPHIGAVPPLFIGNAAWTLFLVGATTYAIVRFRLFTIDLRVKTFIRYGSFAAIEGALFVIISELLEDRTPFDGTASLVAALAIAAGLYPVSRLTRRLADRLMPGVADDDEYRARRRREIYRAALHRAWADGSVNAEEKAALDVLWKSLGISGRDARELEQEIRPRTAASAGQRVSGTA